MTVLYEIKKLSNLEFTYLNERVTDMEQQVYDNVAVVYLVEGIHDLNEPADPQKCRGHLQINN